MSQDFAPDDICFQMSIIYFSDGQLKNSEMFDGVCMMVWIDFIGEGFGLMIFYIGSFIISYWEILKDHPISFIQLVSFSKMAIYEQNNIPTHSFKLNTSQWKKWNLDFLLA